MLAELSPLLLLIPDDLLLPPLLLLILMLLFVLCLALPLLAMDVVLRAMVSDRKSTRLTPVTQ